MRSIIPVTVIVAAILAIWQAGSIAMNSKWTMDQARRAGVELTTAQIVMDTLNQERPRLPAPHQVGAELWKTVAQKKVTSKRSLVYHAWVTMSATLLGFAIGTGLGIMLAVGIVHNRAMDMSVMPWAIASQAIPILAIAPMVIVTLNAIGIQGLFPKAIISAYLSFFPVVVGMVRGLRSPDSMQMDLLRTYSAGKLEALFMLRFPASLPYLFTSLKVGMAASLVGAIVGELPTGAVAGLGARLLAGSYYGQTVQIWSALFAAAALAALMVGLIGLAQRIILRKMGMAR